MSSLVSKTEKGEYQGMSEIFELTQKIIDTFEYGTKLDTPKIIEQVMKDYSGDVEGNRSNIAHLVKMFIRQNKNIKIVAGRAGGAYVGGKLKRVDARPRCQHCNQVIRSKQPSKPKSIEIDGEIITLQ